MEPVQVFVDSSAFCSARHDDSFSSSSQQIRKVQDKNNTYSEAQPLSKTNNSSSRGIWDRLVKKKFSYQRIRESSIMRANALLEELEAEALPSKIENIATSNIKVSQNDLEESLSFKGRIVTRNRLKSLFIRDVTTTTDATLEHHQTMDHLAAVKKEATKDSRNYWCDHQSHLYLTHHLPALC